MWYRIWKEYCNTFVFAYFGFKERGVAAPSPPHSMLFMSKEGDRRAAGNIECGGCRGCPFLLTRSKDVNENDCCQQRGHHTGQVHPIASHVVQSFL